ncbi:MAG: hypothetical protein SNJ64_01585 [Endomicrobiia bacterium]
MENSRIKSIFDNAETERKYNSTPIFKDGKDWTNYVMSFLWDDEKIDGRPCLSGLRRVACLLYGYFSTTIQIVQCPNNDNGQKAILIYEIQFSNGFKVSEIGESDINNDENLKKETPLTTALINAEIRTLKKVLLLDKILLHEEKRRNEKR